MLECKNHCALYSVGGCKFHAKLFIYYLYILYLLLLPDRVEDVCILLPFPDVAMLVPKLYTFIRINIRAVKVNTLIYEIIVAEINAIKYFNAYNATLFTSGLLCLLPVLFRH